MSDGFAESFRSLADKIRSEIEEPKDHWEVAAILEVGGIRDIDARSEYGCADVFELARKVLALVQESRVAVPHVRPRQAPLLWRLVRGYAEGVVFAMPMTAQIFAMFLFGYSLWAWVDFNLREATAIGLGTIASLLVTGGFAQAVARKGLFYVHQQEHLLAKRVCYLIFAAGLLTMIALGLLFLLINLLFDVFPRDMVFYSQLYYYLLSTLWLSFSILYMLRQQVLFALITVLAIGAVHGAILLLRWPMIAAQSLGLLAAVLMSSGAGWFILHRRARRDRADVTASQLPRPSIIAYSLGPYFWFGFLYFAFLFADRIIAWSSDTGRGLIPYFIWFDSRYELGMDWALFCFILTVGVLEFTIQEFSDQVVPAEKAASANQIGEFNRRFTRFYYSHLALFLVVAMLSIFGSYAGITLLRDNELFPFIEVMFQPVTQPVFWWAAVGYVFLVWGLLNSVFLFGLSRPNLILRSLVPALFLNVTVGFVLSRAVRYDLAVVGLTTGALAFMLISGYYTRRTLKNLDYFYYSAY